ncbi:MAG: hypothetical protein HY303_09695 [Candidatus Wallbacteria bacterium]|nr:hypothetical protein [Candidatus Wallbacteria bacterium]
MEHRCIGRDELLSLARARVEFVVRDARSGEDLTQTTLLALLTEGGGAVSAAMSIDFLRELAGLQQQVVRDFFQKHLPAAFKAYVELGRPSSAPLQNDPGSPEAPPLRATRKTKRS